MGKRLLARVVVLALVVFLAPGALAGTVAEVLDGGRRLKVNVDDKLKSGQVVCVVRESKRVACGLMGSTQNGQSLVSLDFRNQMPAVGDAVVSAYEAKGLENAKGRAPASTPVQTGDYVRLREASRDNWLLGVAGGWDLDQITTTFSLDSFVSPRVAFGIRFSIFDLAKSIPEIDGYGLTLSRTFWANRRYTGIHASLAAGVYFFKLGIGGTRSEISGVFEGSVGWSLRIFRGLIGTGFVGVAYYTRPKTDGVYIGIFHLLRPSFGISFGVPF